MYLILLAVVLRSLASAFAKQAAITSIGLGLYGMVVNVWFVLELLTLTAQAFVWVLVLRRTSLSVAYPFLGLVFVLNLCIAALVFREPVGLQHIVGASFILFGILILGPERN